MKTVLFYSSVRDKTSFSIMSFYRVDIDSLYELGYEVIISNKLFDFLLFWKYDIAFIYFYRKGVFGAILSRLFGKPVFFTGGIDYLNSNFNSNYFLRLVQSILLRLSVVISTRCNIVSESDYLNINKYFNCKQYKLYVFPHSVGFNMEKSLELNKEKIISTICWMGSVENVIRKGLIQSLDLFHTLYKYNDEYKFLIIGSTGSGTEFLNKYIAEKNMPKENILFLGELSDYEKYNILGRSMFYFQLSQYEGFGIAALEALAYKNIVIHSGQGGLAETISNHGCNIGWPCNFKKAYEMFLKYHLSNGIEQDYFDEVVFNHIRSKFDKNIRKRNLARLINLKY